MRCKNCDHQFEGRFCPACGQPASVERFDFHFLWRSILESLDLDKGIWRALRMIMLAPGISLRRYIEGHRIGFFNPIKLFLLFGAISTLLQFKLGLYGGAVGEDYLQFEHAERFAYYSAKYSTFFSVFAIPTFALVSWVAYRSSGLNYIENIILNVYIAAGQFLIFLFLVPLSYYAEGPVVGILYSVVNVSYNVWVLSTFFKKTSLVQILGAFVVVLISYVAMLLTNYTLFGMTPHSFWAFIDNLVD